MTKLILAALCGQLWVFLYCAFIAATFDFPQWDIGLRLACVMFGAVASFGAVGFIITTKQGGSNDL